MHGEKGQSQDHCELTENPGVRLWGGLIFCFGGSGWGPANCKITKKMGHYLYCDACQQTKGIHSIPGWRMWEFWHSCNFQYTFVIQTTSPFEACFYSQGAHLTVDHLFWEETLCSVLASGDWDECFHKILEVCVPIVGGEDHWLSFWSQVSQNFQGSLGWKTLYARSYGKWSE